MKLLASCFLLLTSVFLFSCGGSTLNVGEDYGNILTSPDGLVLVESEHQIGWGHSECTMCHNLENIHLVDRSEISIDIKSIHDQALSEGISGCATCHGANGT